MHAHGDASLLRAAGSGVAKAAEAKMELITNGIPPDRSVGILVAKDATALNVDVL